MAIMVEIQQNKTIPDGEYEAILTGVSEFESKNGPILRFKFDIVEPGYETSVSGICSKLLTPRSKLYKWLQAFNVVLPESGTIDLESFVGLRAIVDVAIHDDGTNQFLNVVNIKKVGRRINKSVEELSSMNKPPISQNTVVQSVPPQGVYQQQPSQINPNQVGGRFNVTPASGNPVNNVAPQPVQKNTKFTETLNSLEDIRFDE